MLNDLYRFSYLFACYLQMYMLSFIALNFLTNNLFLYIKYVALSEQYYDFILLFVLGSSTLSLPVSSLSCTH
jgi:hypothetical protein